MLSSGLRQVTKPKCWGVGWCKGACGMCTRHGAPKAKAPWEPLEVLGRTRPRPRPRPRPLGNPWKYLEGQGQGQLVCLKTWCSRMNEMVMGIIHDSQGPLGTPGSTWMHNLAGWKNDVRKPNLKAIIHEMGRCPEPGVRNSRNFTGCIPRSDDVVWTHTQPKVGYLKAPWKGNSQYKWRVRKVVN